MANKEKETLKIALPEKVSAKLANNVLNVKGPFGEVSRVFSKVPVEVKASGREIHFIAFGSRRSDHAVLNTCESHLNNMIKGVTQGFKYKLKVAYAHFPITIKVKGPEVHIENFYGERFPRVAKVVGSQTKVTPEGDDVIVTGPSIEEVSQTAANIESATRVKDKDVRIFLDGVYIYERKQPA
jgi:large subunit ribosomal protein L6